MALAAILRNRSQRASFLCYHSIAPEGPRFLTVSPELFERQLGDLRRRRLRFGDLSALAEVAVRGKGPPTVFLTFDDGFLDNYTTVLPILREFGGRAFVFVLPPKLDAGAAFDWPEVAEDQRRYPESMRSVTWAMLEEMSEGGFEVGSHTLSHRHLIRLDGEALHEELWQSRARIKERLGRCDVLAYPFGDWSPAVEAAAADCGYSFAFTLATRDGQRSATPLSIPRINVDYRDEHRRFATKLSPIGKRAFLSPSLRTIHRLAGRH